MKIIGAGMAGLIAANYFSRYKPTVLEIQKELPHNHSALLRFKTNVIGEAMKIPFTKVLVHKSIVHGDQFIEKSNPFVCNQYSLKVIGSIRSRSIWNTESDYRYIAPYNLIEQLAKDVDIKYSTDFNLSTKTESEPIISTIPMLVMMKKIGWKCKANFGRRRIWALNADIDIDIDVYQTIYFSDFDKIYYRASIVGNKLIAEFCAEPEQDAEYYCSEILSYFGMDEDTRIHAKNVTMKVQEYGKIVEVDDEERKEFIYTLTRDHGIYSLGRFATWRQILLDDLISDLDVIHSLMRVEGKRKLYNQSLTAAHQEKDV